MQITDQSISVTLQDNLRSAMAAELTTIPTYLYAYWSIKPLSDGGSEAGARAGGTIMSVIVEEMLHMGLVSNILNALGGTPAITTPPYLPEYPCKLLRPNPHQGIDVEVHLRRLSSDSIRNFLGIELPEFYDPGVVVTLGEFYNSYIVPELTPDKDYSNGKQLPEYDNPGVGKLIQVSSRKDALAAVQLIVEQGEGLSKQNHDDGEHELAHFWKFFSVHKAVDNGFLNFEQDVYQVIDNPDASQYNCDQQQANQAFNVTYSKLLDALQETFTSENPDVFYISTNLMNQLRQQAAVLRNQGMVAGTNYLPGPTFEYIPESQRN